MSGSKLSTGLLTAIAITVVFGGAVILTRNQKEGMELAAKNSDLSQQNKIKAVSTVNVANNTPKQLNKSSSSYDYKQFSEFISGLSQKIVLDQSCVAINQDPSNPEYLQNTFARLDNGNRYSQFIHIGHWKTTYSTPNGDFSVEAFWNGDDPSTYNVELSGANLNSELLPLFEGFNNGLSWFTFSNTMQDIEAIFEGHNIKAKSSTHFASEFIPKEDDVQSVNISAEFKNGEVQYFANHLTMCNSENSSTINCVCHSTPFAGH